MPRTIDRVSFEGPAGRLEGLLHRPAEAPRAAAVVAHPHPLHGGTMDNKVVYRVARAIEESGALVLRFNFRGVGASEGEHDAGRGEQDDVRAALAFLRAQGPGLPVLLAGFSFGSVAVARVGVTDHSIAGILMVGAPTRTTSLEELRSCERPVAFVHGGRDEHGPRESIEAFAESLPCPVAVRIVEGAGHFFDEEQDELQDAVRSVLDAGTFGPAFVGRAT